MDDRRALLDYERETLEGVLLRIPDRVRRAAIEKKWLAKPESRPKRRAAVRRYYETPRGQIAHSTKQARRRGAMRTRLTTAEQCRIAGLYATAKRLTKETGLEHHVDHDRPLSRGGKHHPDNLLVIPAAMNRAKGARYESTMQFLLS